MHSLKPCAQTHMQYSTLSDFFISTPSSASDRAVVHELVILPRTQLSSSVLHLRLYTVCCSQACLTLLNPGGYFANLSITFSTYLCF